MWRKYFIAIAVISAVVFLVSVFGAIWTSGEFQQRLVAQAFISALITWVAAMLGAFPE